MQEQEYLLEEEHLTIEERGDFFEFCESSEGRAGTVGLETLTCALPNGDLITKTPDGIIVEAHPVLARLSFSKDAILTPGKDVVRIRDREGDRSIAIDTRSKKEQPFGRYFEMKNLNVYMIE